MWDASVQLKTLSYEIKADPVITSQQPVHRQLSAPSSREDVASFFVLDLSVFCDAYSPVFKIIFIRFTARDTH